MSAKEFQLVNCISCNRKINPREQGQSRYLCPECSVVQIARCSKCRSLGNRYKCVGCEFEGP